MISVKKHYVALVNLRGTLAALENIDRLIAHYGGASASLPGPAYVQFNHVRVCNNDKPAVQFDREIMVAALLAQRSKLFSYLADMGIEYDRVV